MLALHCRSVRLTRLRHLSFRSLPPSPQSPKRQRGRRFSCDDSSRSGPGGLRGSQADPAVNQAPRRRASSVRSTSPQVPPGLRQPIAAASFAPHLAPTTRCFDGQPTGGVHLVGTRLGDKSWGQVPGSPGSAKAHRATSQCITAPSGHGASMEQSGRNRRQSTARLQPRKAGQLLANRCQRLHPLAADPRW